MNLFGEMQITGMIGPEERPLVIGCARPGYPSVSVDDRAVEAWMKEARSLGVRDIICLLDRSQLSFYRGLSAGGLLKAYDKAGFNVHHYPTPDGLHPPLSRGVLDTIAADLSAMKYPVLVHCSAGMDRTGAVMEHLRIHMGKDSISGKAPDQTGGSEPPKRRRGGRGK